MRLLREVTKRSHDQQIAQLIPHAFNSHQVSCYHATGLLLGSVAQEELGDNPLLKEL